MDNATSFNEINERLDGMAVELGQTTKRQRDTSNQVNTINDVLVGLGGDKAIEAFAKYEARIDGLSKKVQCYIIRSCVFSGLVMMARKKGQKELVSIIEWFYRNECAEDRKWVALENMPLDAWYKIALSGKDLS